MNMCVDTYFISFYGYQVWVCVGWSCFPPRAVESANKFSNMEQKWRGPHLFAAILLILYTYKMIPF